MNNIVLDQVNRFLDWTAKKVKVHYAERGEVRFHEREIWWDFIALHNAVVDLIKTNPSTGVVGFSGPLSRTM